MKTNPLLKPTSVVLFSLIASLLLGMGAMKQPESADQQQIIYLEVDGIEHEVLVGEPTEIMIGKSKHTINVRFPTVNIFSSELITFEYPAHLDYKQTDMGDLGVAIWQLSESNALLMIQEYDEPIENMILVNELFRRYESMDMTGTGTEIEFDFGGEHLVGQRLTVNAMGTELIQEVFTIQHSGRSVSFLMQYINDEENGSILVFNEFKALLGSSLKLK